MVRLWFTEWSENKIGRLNVNKQLPFRVSTTPEELNLTRGNSAEIKVLVQATSDVTVNMTGSKHDLFYWRYFKFNRLL